MQSNDSATKEAALTKETAKDAAPAKEAAQAKPIKAKTARRARASVLRDMRTLFRQQF